MKAFAAFIESEAFFPVLCGLLSALILVFIWILVSNSRRAQKLKQKKAESIDDTAVIKIVKEYSNEAELLEHPKEIEQPQDNLISGDEVSLFREQIIEAEKEITLPSDTPVDNSVVLPNPQPNDENPTPKVDYVPVDNSVANLEFPDFTGITDNSSSSLDDELAHAAIDVENDVIEAANKYIESVMVNKDK